MVSQTEGATRRRGWLHGNPAEGEGVVPGKCSARGGAAPAETAAARWTAAHILTAQGRCGTWTGGMRPCGRRDPAARRQGRHPLHAAATHRSTSCGKPRKSTAVLCRRSRRISALEELDEGTGEEPHQDDSGACLLAPAGQGHVHAMRLDGRLCADVSVAALGGGAAARHAAACV